MKKLLIYFFSLIVIILIVFFLFKHVRDTTIGDKNIDRKNNLNAIETDKNKSNEFVGKWSTVKAINSETGIETNNMIEVFGNSYETKGSYIEFKKDGTFIDRIEPITNGSKPSKGKYIIKKDYYKKGDTYIFLYYTDDIVEKVQKIIISENKEIYLVLDHFVNDYQLYLQKEHYNY